MNLRIFAHLTQSEEGRRRKEVFFPSQTSAVSKLNATVTSWDPFHNCILLESVEQSTIQNTLTDIHCYGLHIYNIPHITDSMAHS